MKLTDLEKVTELQKQLDTARGRLKTFDEEDCTYVQFDFENRTIGHHVDAGIADFLELLRDRLARRIASIELALLDLGVEL